MKTGAKNVVTLSGSFLAGELHVKRDKQKVASITAAMLDKGTSKKNKYEISRELESVGAEIHFMAGRNRTNFTAHCLTDDIKTTISLLAEQLMLPVFPEEELSILKTRIIGNLTRAKEDTKKLASIALLQKLYPKKHHNYRESLERSINIVEGVSKQDVLAFYNEHYGLGSINIVAAGDISHDIFENEIAEAFGSWEQKETKKLSSKTKAFEKTLAEENIYVPEKTSADLYIGQPIGIDRNHENYHALMMAVYILGGNFSARLMQTVRDQQGLTYGIGSSVSGVENGADGYWSTWGTFAPEVVSKGKDATMEQIVDWHKNGVTHDELTAKQTTITGAYKVGMDTTGGIVNKILTNAERDRPLNFLDVYPDKIKTLTLGQVNGAIHKYIDPKNLITISAGTLE